MKKLTIIALSLAVTAAFTVTAAQAATTSLGDGSDGCPPDYPRTSAVGTGATDWDAVGSCYQQLNKELKNWEQECAAAGCWASTSYDYNMDTGTPITVTCWAAGMNSPSPECTP
jgi:hypothetical protein